MQEPGWLNVHVKKSTKKAAEVAERVAIAERGRGISKVAPRMRKPTAPRQPQLPPEDLKVVLRPRGGFDATQLPTVAVRDGVLRAAEITYDKASGDTLRVNFRQNTLTMSTPSKEKAVLYSKITTIRINANDYETVVYVTAPEDTSKGVIHGIPEEETQEDIEKTTGATEPADGARSQRRPRQQQEPLEVVSTLGGRAAGEIPLKVQAEARCVIEVTRPATMGPAAVTEDDAGEHARLTSRLGGQGCPKSTR
ncbi:hypothetical protein HPB49_008241 [Dermacentor silvarum]|uniref:Uncharacterized protein n=1 Tax=Dermacentor silvarum TaxID=543639 RepID=A0ACB8C2P4_DERSI|nr:hypothetical protein HPB49_008241 [Dermacentor silvarum]